MSSLALYQPWLALQIQGEMSSKGQGLCHALLNIPTHYSKKHLKNAIVYAWSCIAFKKYLKIATICTWFCKVTLCGSISVTFLHILTFVNSLGICSMGLSSYLGSSSKADILVDQMKCRSCTRMAN